MPSIVGKVADRRIIVPVALVVPVAGAVDYGSPSSLLNVSIHRTTALLDTGAQSTCVTRSAVQAYGLIATGKKMMGNANSDEMHNTYAFRIAFCLSGEKDAERIWHIDRDLAGADIKSHPAFEILLGMDIIGMGDLTITRNGRFVFDFP